MKATGIAITMLAAAAIAARPAVAGPPFLERCCACLPGDIDAGTSGAVVLALACATIVTQEQLLEFENQCSDLHGHTDCFAQAGGVATQGADHLNCSAIFDLSGIICPGVGRTAPVPVLDPNMLAGLALFLGGLGAFGVRRRLHR